MIPHAQHWALSFRADPYALPLADRHYNRQKIGSPQFVPPGRCLVLLSHAHDAVWVTSYPYAQYVKHAWAGAWVNSLFRNESDTRASDLILEAIAISRSHFDVPDLGVVSFVDPKKVPAVRRRGKTIYGYCYLKAGFEHVGYTKDGKWAWQLKPAKFPEAIPVPALRVA